jgi:peptide methionine sulfoxide reductase MsrA
MLPLLSLLISATTTTTSLAQTGGTSVPADDNLRLYVGNGCFWARQHLFVEEFERKLLNRSDDEITAVAGYAGSTKTGAGNTLCYHNPDNFSDYGLLGHAEAVQVDVPQDAVQAAFATFFRSFVELSPGKWVREDYFDQGAEYRSLLGFPGGFANERLMAAVRRANLHNMTLLPGHGSDPDTFEASSVYIMDSTHFPFKQAEFCLQFHDDQVVKYPRVYHDLREVSQKHGRLVHTGCPANFVCNNTLGKTPIEDAMPMII